MYLAGKIKAHDFRHYFAATEYQKDHDIYRVSKLLNHASIAVTETYLKSINVILQLPIILGKPIFSFPLPLNRFYDFYVV